ncbi:MAG: protein-glutamate O-methyltransferase CheR [Candidatus Hydrogenedentes bacterium]|nr:protein-glutamate O-methyltransferase CheR [Candidatus Hydrogenedentota bacterium]
MDEQTFIKFRDLIYQKSGISLGPQKIALVSSRITKRIRALHFSSEADYLNHVLADDSGEELVCLLDAISTNVTSFFREPAHFDLLSRLLRQWKNEGADRFRIWCAASSTGEEPYCIAMTALEALGTATDFRLLASDISTRALTLAREGVYDGNKLEPVPQDLKNRYFEPVETGNGAAFQAVPGLRKLISFNRLNLSTPPFPMKGPLDAVFCRNVMIYFDRKVRLQLLQEIHRLLKPGGYLLIGHSESLASMKTPFSRIEPSVYRKL